MKRLGIFNGMVVYSSPFNPVDIVYMLDPDTTYFQDVPRKKDTSPDYRYAVNKWLRTINYFK